MSENDKLLRQSWIIALAVLIVATTGVATSWFMHQSVVEARQRQQVLEGRFQKIENELAGVRELIKVVEAESRRPRQWEYRIEAPGDFAFDIEMTKYGREGWELVAARRASSGGSMAYEMIFRRPTMQSAITTAE